MRDSNLINRSVQHVVAICVCFVFALSVIVQGAEVNLDTAYGAEVNPTGSPIGGGAGYHQIYTTGDYIVHNTAELLAALNSAQPGEVVYVAPEAEIDLTGKKAIMIKPGVTLAGARGYQNSPGPLIYCDEYDTYGLFEMAPGSRLTGIRLRGPDPDILEGAYVRPNSMAVTVFGDKAEVDNCEIYHWSYAGVAVEGDAKDVYIHHNNIHHVRRAGLGYPVVVNKGYALIEANTFDYYRHAIASTGYIGTGYEARYNLVLTNATSHAFDMHGGGDYCPKRQAPCTEEELWMAGEWLHIHHNTFVVAHQAAIVVRGVPREYAKVHNNWFYSSAVSQSFRVVYYNGGNMAVYNNAYGASKNVVTEYVKPSPLVRRGSIIGEGEIVAMAAIAGDVEFGIQGLINNQLLSEPIDVLVAVDLRDVFDVKDVELRLDGEVIYTNTQGSSSGTVTIDPYQLEDGSHTLTLTVRNAQRETMTKTMNFRVRNWWTLDDDMLPPLSSGWFGSIDRSQTIEESAGWGYRDDYPENFAGDVDRKALDAEYDTGWLIWHTPGITEYRVTLFSQDAQLSNVKLVVSADKVNWVELPYELYREESPRDGWYHYELNGNRELDMAIQYFRITVTDNKRAPIQIGAFTSTGFGVRTVLPVQ
jgi:hypothetical protein